MIENPTDVLEPFPVRKNKKQKQAFRDSVQSYITTLGYDSTVEKGSMGARNVIIGNPKTARYLITAHYDTPAKMPFPNLITPCSPVGFLGYQLLIAALILGVCSIPGLILTALGMDSDYAAFVWLLCVYGSLALMLLGPANKSNANDNTSGVVTVLETAKALPEELKDKVCFVLFDLEEAGLIGSSSYAKIHKKEIGGQVILNLDCVGDGDELILFPTKKAKKDTRLMKSLAAICASGEKNLTLRKCGFSYYPSDQKNFPVGVGIAAFRRSKFFGPYCSRIHTSRDKILDERNVSFLRDRLIALISESAAE